MRRICLILVAAGMSLMPGLAHAAKLMEEYPDLKRYLFEPPKSRFYVGFGINPLGFASNRFYFSANVLQVHWISEYFNYEILSASIGSGLKQQQAETYRNLLIRTVPKLKLGSFFSIGPLIGYELITFPDVSARLVKSQAGGDLFGPYEPFSSRSFVFGGVLSEDIHLSGGYILKFNQVYYRQRYNTDSIRSLQYRYLDPTIQEDATRAAVRPGSVFMLEFSLLF